MPYHFSPKSVWDLAARAQKTINRASWWNGKFDLFQMLATGGGGGQTYVQKLSAPLTIGVRAFIQSWGATGRNRTVISDTLPQIGHR